MEECYARATVAGTRAQSLTVIVSPLDMQGMMGMMQVLAGRAHTIHELYRGNDNWQLPQLEEPQIEQSKAEVHSWRISHAGTWAEQNLPPLAIGFNLRRKVDGQERVVFLRLRLVLVKASKIPSARTHISQLEHIVNRAYDTRHKLTLPDQRTDDLMLWGYAIDKQHRVMAWLGPACSSPEPFAPVIRHWRSGTIMRTVPLPGIHFFDAWRIRSQLSPDPKLGEKLPSLGTTELIPEEPANEDYGHGDRADIQHRREQDVRGSTKTIAQLALEMSHVHRLADLIKEKADMLKELAMRRQSYQDEVKDSVKGKSTVATSAPKKQRTTGEPASVANPVPTPLPTAHGGKAMEVNVRVGTSQSSSTPFPWPFTQSPSTGGTPAAPSRHDSLSVPASAPPPAAQQEDQASTSHQKGVQAGAFFFLRLPIGQYGPVSQLSRLEERCTGPFNWGEAHCAGEKVKRKIGPFLRKSLKNQTRTRTQQKGAQPATATRNPLARLPGARANEETNPTNKRLHQQILVRLNVLDLQWTIL